MLGGGEALVHVVVLLVANVRAAQHAEEEHAHGGDAVQGQCAAFGELLGGEAQRGAPQEGLSQRIHRRRRHDDPAGGIAEEDEPPDGDGCADDQQADGRDLVHDGPGVKAQHRHDDGYIHKDPRAEILDVWTAELEQFRHPPIGAQLRGGQRPDGDENHDEKPVAQGPPRPAPRRR